ncbi:MAG: hypothetical protein H7Y38_15340, partial [Armatimonadetes bacterium]|nr:hypothetical protein [Armatimonadota bacterium]
ATDAKWLLPHFEKMLYDNALLLRVYAEAGELLDNEAYRRVARETADWCLRDLLDPGTGGFTAALDADSEGVEGKYYVWTTGEVQAILGDAGAAFARTYRFTDAGNFVDEATHTRTGANIPHLSLGADAVPLPAALPAELLAPRQRLLDARYERVPPGKDDKIITAWNGLMIGALAFAGKMLGEPAYTAAAKRAANFCLTTLRPNGELLRRYAKGEAAIPAFLDDYAFLADGLLDLHDATGETEWVNEARALMDTLLERFWDANETGFFYTGTAHETLIERTKEFFDGALPAANGVAARVLARLGNLPNGERYAETVRELLTAYHGLLARAPQGTPTLILAARESYRDAMPTVSVREAVVLRADTDTLTLAPGEYGSAKFTLTVADGYHINARYAPRADLVATVAMIGTSAPAAIGAVAFPAPTYYDDGAGETLPVYVGVVSVTIPVTPAHDAEPGTYSVTLTVRAQPCTNFECLTPLERTASLKLVIPAPPEHREETWETLVPHLQGRIESANDFLNVNISEMEALGVDADGVTGMRTQFENTLARLTPLVPLVARMCQVPQVQSIKPFLSLQQIRLIDAEEFAWLEAESDDTYRLSRARYISGLNWEHSLICTGTLDEIVAATVALVESRVGESRSDSGGG